MGGERLEDPREAAGVILDSLRRVAEEAVVKVTRSKSFMVKVARGSVSVSQSWDELDVEVYATKSKRVYVSSFQTANPSVIVDSVERFLERLPPSKLYAPLPEPSGTSSEAVDPRIAKLVEASDVTPVLEVLDPDTWGDISGMSEVYMVDEALEATNGASYTRRVTGFEGYVRIFKGKDVSGQWSWVSTKLDLEMARKSVEAASEHAEMCASLERETPEPGVYRIALSPMISGNLIEMVARASTATAVLFGMSFLAGRKPGDKVASEAFTLESTPLDDELPGYTGFDDEGVATRNVGIIEHGILKTLLHNTKTSRLMGGSTTGNAGWLFPKIFNLRVQPGDVASEEVFEALGDGVYVSNNWYTRFQNHLEGSFSTVPRDAAYIVRGGKPKACSPGYKFRLAGRLGELVAGIESLGKEIFNIKWWEVNVPFKIPYIIVSRGLEVRKA